MAIEKRYDSIVEAARDVIARHGYHQASIRRIARAAGLSLAGLYHYVGGKDELLFLVLDRGLDRLLGALDVALAAAPTAELKLYALVRTHLEFAFQDAAALKIINRDWELLLEPRRHEIVARRAAYLGRGMAVLRELDPRRRSPDALYSATNLLLAMLNGIATRPFLRSATGARALAGEVSTLFLHGFLDRSRDGHALATVPSEGETHEG